MLKEKGIPQEERANLLEKILEDEKIWDELVISYDAGLKAACETLEHLLTYSMDL